MDMQWDSDVSCYTEGKVDAVKHSKVLSHQFITGPYKAVCLLWFSVVCFGAILSVTFQLNFG